MSNLDRLPLLPPVTGSAGAGGQGGTSPTRSRTNTAEEALRNVGNTQALTLMLPSAMGQAQAPITVLGRGRYISVSNQTS